MTKVTVEIRQWVDDTEQLDRYDAVIGGENVGYLTTRPATDGGLWIEGLEVKPPLQRYGIARQLLEHVIKLHGDTDLSLRAKPYRDAPLAVTALEKFYSSFGFRTYDHENRMRRPGC